MHKTDLRLHPEKVPAAVAPGLSPVDTQQGASGAGHDEPCPPGSTAPNKRRSSGRPLLAALWRFLQFGGFAFALNIAITATAHELVGLPATIAFGLALVTVFFVSFFGFRRFVYRASGSPRRQMLRFLAVFVPFRAAEYGAFLLLVPVAGMDYLVATVLVLATSAIAKFFTFRHWVFTP